MQVAVPDLVGFLRKRQPPRLDSRFRRIEQAQLHERCVFGEQREVHALAIPSRAERRGFAGPDGVVVDHGNAEKIPRSPTGLE